MSININIKLDGIGHMLSDRKLSVPTYQRTYAWKEEHISNLFQDLAKAIKNKESEYFLGSVVVNERSPECPEVVDGQQRLATITILLAAIRNYFLSIGDKNGKDRADGIEKKYLINKDIDSLENIPQFQTNEIDNDFFIKKILSHPGNPERNILPTKDSHRRIAKADELAKQFLINFISGQSDQSKALLEFKNYIDSSIKVILVTVPDESNAFTIFETLNDRGLSLAITDLIKNHLFSLAGNRIDEVKNFWISMMGVLETAREDKADELMITYIYHFWCSKHSLTREKELFKAIKKEISTREKCIDFAKELFDNSKLYVAIINPSNTNEIWGKYRNNAKLNIETLNMFRMGQIRPLILAILSSFTKDAVARSLKFLVSSSVRLLICGTGGGTLEQTISDNASKIRKKEIKDSNELFEAMRKVIPNDTEFKSAFETATVSKAYLARYYLRCIEKLLRGKDIEMVPNDNKEEINLEHILPENPSSKWNHFSLDEKTIYYKKIGNLTLLKNKINSKSGNDSFKDKVPYYKKSKLKLNLKIAQYAQWTKKEIEYRQKRLAELAIKVWAYKI
ncbi:MAG: DUF262 domain-containing protein [Elusimicrobia bacterium]|nr:DUF262 domain-containing protein [Elusimicrobiota bacterium]